MGNDTMRNDAINWLKDGCKPTGAQFAAIMNAVFFKQDGRLITKTETLPNGDVTLNFSNGKALTIEKFKLKQLTIPDIEGLGDALAQRVQKVDGKQLSTNDFSDVLKQKLENLFNYQKPGSEPIGYIDGLQKILDNKVNKQQLEQDLTTKAEVKALSDYAKADASNLDQDQVQAWRMQLDSFNGQIPLVSDQEQITLTPDKPHVSYTGTFAEPTVIITFDPDKPNAQVKHIIHNQSERILTVKVSDGLLIDGKAEKQVAPHTGSLISPETDADGTIASFGSWGPNSEQWLRLDASNATPKIDAYFRSLIASDTTADTIRITGFDTPLLAQGSAQTLTLRGSGLRTHRALSFVLCGEDGQELSADLIKVLRYDTTDSSEKLYVILSAGTADQDKVKVTVKLLLDNKPTKGSATLCLFDEEKALETIAKEDWKTYTELDAAAYDIAVTDDGIDYKGGQVADFQVAATAPGTSFSAEGDYWLVFTLEAAQRSGKGLSFGLTPKEGYTPNACDLDLYFGARLSLSASEAHFTPLSKGYPAQAVSIPGDFPIQFQILKVGNKLSLEVLNANTDGYRFEAQLDSKQSQVFIPKLCFEDKGTLDHVSILKF